MKIHAVTNVARKMGTLELFCFSNNHWGVVNHGPASCTPHPAKNFQATISTNMDFGHDTALQLVSFWYLAVLCLVLQSAIVFWAYSQSRVFLKIQRFPESQVDKRCWLIAKENEKRKITRRFARGANTTFTTCLNSPAHVSIPTAKFADSFANLWRTK